MYSSPAAEVFLCKGYVDNRSILFILGINKGQTYFNAIGFSQMGITKKNSRLLCVFTINVGKKKVHLFGPFITDGTNNYHITLTKLFELKQKSFI